MAGLGAGARSLLWARATRGPIASTLSAGDMDRDGHADIFAITQTGVIYRYDETGREIWNIDMQGRTIGAGALIDLQNDGQLDYVLCTQSGRMLALYSKATGSNEFKAVARQALNYCLYAINDDGCPGDQAAFY